MCSAYMCSMEIIQIPHSLFMFYDCIQTAESLLCRSQHYCVGIYLHTDTFLRRSIEESGYELPVSYGHTKPCVMILFEIKY